MQTNEAKVPNGGAIFPKMKTTTNQEVNVGEGERAREGERKTTTPLTTLQPNRIVHALANVFVKGAKCICTAYFKIP